MTTLYKVTGQHYQTVMETKTTTYWIPDPPIIPPAEPPVTTGGGAGRPKNEEPAESEYIWASCTLPDGGEGSRMGLIDAKGRIKWITQCA